MHDFARKCTIGGDHLSRPECRAVHHGGEIEPVPGSSQSFISVGLYVSSPRVNFLNVAAWPSGKRTLLPVRCMLYPPPASPRKVRHFCAPSSLSMSSLGHISSVPNGGG